MKKQILTFSSLLLSFISVLGHAEAANPTKIEIQPDVLNVISFSGGWNLPTWIAERQGFFKNEGLKVNLIFTPNSKELAEGLANNKYQIAIAGLDNVIAYRELQGPVKIENNDFFAFMGVDNGLLSLVAKPEIKTAKDLKGRKLSVDALTTGYAFVLRDYLKNNQIKDADISSIGSTNLRYDALMGGKTDATLLRTPLDIQAKNNGFNILASGSMLGDFQGTVGVASQAWAKSHKDALVKFIKAYKKGLDWMNNPNNKVVAEAILIANDKDMTPELAPKALRELQNGLQKTAEINQKGVINVMNLRSKYAEPKKELKNPMKYYDMSYYKLAY